MAAHTNNTYVCTTDTTDVCLDGSSACLFNTTHIATKRGQQETNTFNVTNWDCSSMDGLCKDIGNNVSSPTHLSSLKTIGLNPNARDRRHYINPVMKSIENLDQWNLVKEAKRDDTMLAGSNVMKFNARDRKHHVNPVLNPVENIVQWKLAKIKRVTFAVEKFEVQHV